MYIRNCWSFQNGHLDGDGTGFKVAGVHNTTPVTPVLTKNIAAENYLGFFPVEYSDYLRANGRFYNNLAYANDYGFYHSFNPATPVAMAIWRNNIAYENTVSDWLSTYDSYTESHNTWDGESGYPGFTEAIPLVDSNFVSLNVEQLKSPRKADGGLPDVTFGHPSAGSPLIDAGTNVGMSYSGSAPDIGPFEYP